MMRCRPGIVTVRGGPGSAMQRFADARAAPRPGYAMASDAFGALFTFQTAHLRSRGAFVRPGFATLLRSPESRGGRSAERRSGARRNTREARHLASKTRVNALMTRHAERLRGALRPMTRDARLSALHRGGFGLPGPRFRLRHCLRIRAASSSHPGRSAWRAGSRASRGERLRAAAAGRHASLRLQDRLRRRPSMSEAANVLAWPRDVVNSVVGM
jgi:hypothetical protein